MGVVMLINDLLELGELIRRRRAELSLSQTDLAVQIGTTRQWVSRLEKGKNDIGTARLLAVLDALELNLEIRPPRLDSAAKVASEVTSKTSLIVTAALRALAQMSVENMRSRRETGLLLPDAHLPSAHLPGLSTGLTTGTTSVMSALAASVDPGDLAAGRRRILEASLKLSERRAAAKSNATIPDTIQDTEREDA